MVRGKPDNEQIDGFDRIDKVRRELDTKIEGKVSYTVFFGILGTVVVLLLAAVANSNMTSNTAISKLDEVSRRLTVLETKAEERSRQSPITSPSR